MRNAPIVLAAALLASIAAVPPGRAADAPTVVRAALLDMTSTMGMMGHGMMAGPMMQHGWGQGQGPGGWMGPGMMGPGMMGMMSIRIDRPSVKAGAVHLDVTNWSRSMLHELLVVAVDAPSAPLPYDYGQAKVAEDQVRVLGETAELEPNASAGLDVTLPPGSYLLICNIPGHYASGMAVPLVATP